MKHSVKTLLVALLVGAVFALAACSSFVRTSASTDDEDSINSGQTLSSSGSQQSIVETPTVVFDDQQVAFTIPLDDETWNNALQLTPYHVTSAYEVVLSGIYVRSVPSVVQITTDLGSGSGWVWDGNGYLVTNQHVIDNASEIIVTFEDGRSYRADLIGSDADSDLAVLKIDGVQTVPLTLGDSNELRPGHLAVAIGSPFGQDFTLTVGIVSALLRSIPSGSTPFSIPAVIQTDAALNPGNSGGPLLDSSGRIIGVNTQIRSGTGTSAGVGFAVPINLIKRVVPSIIEDGTHEYSYLGITGGSVNLNIRESIGLDDDVRGALVTSVSPGDPAARAGLTGDSQPSCRLGGPCNYDGDIITAINGLTVNTMDQLIAYLSLETSPGDTVLVDILRDQRLQTLEVQLSARPIP